MPITFWREKADEYLRLAKDNPVMEAVLTRLANAYLAAVSEAESAKVEVQVTGKHSAGSVAISPNDSRFRSKTARHENSGSNLRKKTTSDISEDQFEGNMNGQ
jgi:hypothetical protein